MIRPWIFEFFPELENASTGAITDYFKRYLDLWTRDEELGFEGVFFSEHHFGLSYSASPNLLIAALAGRTRSMRLGVMGVVTPWYEPARIVEEIGMLDHLTGGRLEIGTATGVPQELARLGITMEEARERNREALDIIDAALAGDVVTYRGKRFVYENLRLLPRPAQARPPRWTTVVSADSARHAARRGSKISTGFNTTEEIKALFDAYRAEAKASGFEAGPDHLALRRRIVIARSRSEAEEMSRAVRARFMAFAAADTRLKKGALPDAPKKQGDFSLSEDEFIAGPPDVVAEEIIKQCRRIGAGHFLAVLHWGAPFDEVAAAHELFGREVAHALRAAGV